MDENEKETLFPISYRNPYKKSPSLLTKIWNWCTFHEKIRYPFRPYFLLKNNKYPPLSTNLWRDMKSCIAGPKSALKNREISSKKLQLITFKAYDHVAIHCIFVGLDLNPGIRDEIKSPQITFMSSVLFFASFQKNPKIKNTLCIYTFLYYSKPLLIMCL